MLDQNKSPPENELWLEAKWIGQAVIGATLFGGLLYTAMASAIDQQKYEPSRPATITAQSAQAQPCNPR